MLRGGAMDISFCGHRVAASMPGVATLALPTDR